MGPDVFCVFVMSTSTCFCCLSCTGASTAAVRSVRFDTYPYPHRAQRGAGLNITCKNVHLQLVYPGCQTVAESSRRVTYLVLALKLSTSPADSQRLSLVGIRRPFICLGISGSCRNQSISRLSFIHRVGQARCCRGPLDCACCMHA